MNKKTLINLAHDYDFETRTDYLDYIIESMFNGQPKQCKSLYKALKPKDKHWFIEYACQCLEDTTKLFKIIGVKLQ